MVEKKSKEKYDYDFIVVGAGVTGLSAAMYAARLGLSALVLGHSNSSELPVGGVITTTDIVENYPGFITISGRELAKKIEDHARSYESVSVKPENVISVKKYGKGFEVKTEGGSYTGKTVLFATGTKWRKLDVPGSNEYENKGVAYCALCDSPLFKNRIVCVIGGSDSAAKDALVLSVHAKEVYIIYRGDQIRAEPVNLARVKENKKIKLITMTNVTAIEGKDFVTHVVLDKAYNGKKTLDVQGVFVAIGHIFLSDLAKQLGVTLNEKGEIVIDHINSSTNMQGVYAAGDVANKPFKQAITGVAEGCTAAHSAYEYISAQNW